MMITLSQEEINDLIRHLKRLSDYDNNMVFDLEEDPQKRGVSHEGLIIKYKENAQNVSKLIGKFNNTTIDVCIKRAVDGRLNEAYNWEDCKHLRKGIYQKDCWITYNACILEKDGLWDYKTCEEKDCNHNKIKE